MQAHDAPSTNDHPPSHPPHAYRRRRTYRRRPARSPLSRRACPACSRRYAGLIPADCPVCDGIGILALGNAALSRHNPAAVARAVELYLEHAAHRAARDLPYAQRRAALELAVTELRTAGVLATIADTGTPATPAQPDDAQARSLAERDAYTVATDLNARPTTAVLNALAASTIPLTACRPGTHVLAIASANGHPAQLARAADPIDPLGPDLLELAAERRTTEHAGRVLASATDQLATRRTRRQARP